MTTAPSPPSDSFVKLARRLSTASVRQRWEAYEDVDWDDPAFLVRRGDERWELPQWDVLGASEWYQDQPPERRHDLGLYRVAAFLKVGIEFEAVLSQGLLRFASTLPNGHPAFRYLYHEVAEECQHSMMFQELIDRSGFDVPPSPDPVQRMYGELAGGSGVMLFLMALGGEETFDHLQRRMIAEPSMHPLFRRIGHIHAAEEARHLSFARGILREMVPTLDDRERRLLRFRAPFVVRWIANHVIGGDILTDQLTDAWDMPVEVKASIVQGRSASDLLRRSTTRVVGLCHDLGLVDPRLATPWEPLGHLSGP
jgi:hypothetical protein